MNDINKLKVLKIIIFIICFTISIISSVYILIKVFTIDHKIEVLTERDINEIVTKYGCSGFNSYTNDIRVDYAFSTDDSCPFFLGYMVINDGDYLKLIYSLYEDQVEENNNFTSNASFDLGSFQYYESESKGIYNMKVVSYQNSLLVISTNKDDVKLFDNIIKDTGYYYNLNIGYFKYMFIPLLSFFIGIFSLSYINRRPHKSKYYGM